MLVVELAVCEDLVAYYDIVGLLPEVGLYLLAAGVSVLEVFDILTTNPTTPNRETLLLGMRSRSLRGLRA